MGKPVEGVTAIVPVYPGPSGAGVCTGEDSLTPYQTRQFSIPAHGEVVLCADWFLCNVTTPWGGQGNTVLLAEMGVSHGGNLNGLDIRLELFGSEPNYFDSCPRKYPAVKFNDRLATAVASSHHPDSADGHSGGHGFATLGIGVGAGGHYRCVVSNSGSKAVKVWARMAVVGASQLSMYPAEYHYGPTAWCSELCAKEQAQ